MGEREQVPDGSVTAQVASVDVGVDPGTAFLAFTAEVDLWWVRGPINHHRAGQVVAMRCEPGVGGRLLEVYDEATGEGLELARITVWEPGERLAWRSSIDDVITEVTFEASGASTVVRVVAMLPAGGQDRGGTAWLRVVPKWFGPWCARRDRVPHEVWDLARLGLTISYARPAAAARWLARVFAFSSPDPLPEGPDPLPDTGHGHPWIEFRIGNCSLIIGRLDDQGAATPAARLVTHIPWVYVDDIESHYRQAREAGAAIVTDLASPWGLPLYAAEDCEGNRWTFAQARPTMR